MKNKGIFIFVLVFLFVFMSGCISGTAIPYSFAANESENGTATITFVSSSGKVGVDLHFFEDNELPIPKKAQYWAPVIFPAGRTFTLTLNVYGSWTEVGNERIFICPALTAGKDYKLEVEVKEAKTIFGATIKEREEKLILKDAKTRKVVYEQSLL
jgi:hypothetical protein